MSFYSNSKKAYRWMGSPFSKAFFSGNTSFSRTVLSLKSRMESAASHDEIYDRDYYLKYSAGVEQTARVIAEWMISEEKLRTCVDVGCGSGEVLSALAARGVEVFGYDNSDAALALCREKGLSVEKLDLESAPKSPRTADVAISTEVAEHIPEVYADAYVDFLTSTAAVVYVTAATPGQGGTDHVNEQPNSYWIEKFAARGMICDMDYVLHTRSAWRDAGADNHRAGNLLVFREPNG